MPGEKNPAAQQYRQPGHFPLTGGTSTLDLSDVTVNSGSTGVLGLDSRIRGTDADDLIVGTNGNDLLNDLAETSVDYGGDDTVIGGAGDDIIIGGSGADSLIGGSGADYMNGGSGVDTADYSASGAGVTVKIWAGTGVGGDAQGDTLVKIENLIGSLFADTLTGDANENILTGGAGGDVFRFELAHLQAGVGQVAGTLGLVPLQIWRQMSAAGGQLLGPQLQLGIGQPGAMGGAC